MNSIEHNNVFIVLLATGFGHNDHYQAIFIQKLKRGWLHVVHKNVQFCGIAFTAMSVLFNSLTSFFMPL